MIPVVLRIIEIDVDNKAGGIEMAEPDKLKEAWLFIQDLRSISFSST